MGKQKRRQYGADFKRKAVILSCDSEHSITKVAASP